MQPAKTVSQVTDTPKDQEHLERLSVVQFNASSGELRLAPAMQSPLIQREGFVEDQGVFREYKKLIDAGVHVPTNKVSCAEQNLSVEQMLTALVIL